MEKRYIVHNRYEFGLLKKILKNHKTLQENNYEYFSKYVKIFTIFDDNIYWCSDICEKCTTNNCASKDR